jgi:hypothetical protein
MGLGSSKCCKKTAKRGEKTPSKDPEPERGTRDEEPGFSRRNERSKAGSDDEAAPVVSPFDPDPGVFYSRPLSKKSLSSDRSDRSRGMGRTREGRNRRDETKSDSKRHHKKSNGKVGEERILKYHRENPEKAPLLGSSSEEEYDDRGEPVAKNWIGVCPARLQHRVWWWSVTFIVCFILCAGVFLGFAHSFEGRDSHREGSPGPRSPERAPVSRGVAMDGRAEAPGARVEAWTEETNEDRKPRVEELVLLSTRGKPWEARAEATQEAEKRRGSGGEAYSNDEDEAEDEDDEDDDAAARRSSSSSKPTLAKSSRRNPRATLSKGDATRSEEKIETSKRKKTKGIWEGFDVSRLGSLKTDLRSSESAAEKSARKPPRRVGVSHVVSAS